MSSPATYPVHDRVPRLDFPGLRTYRNMTYQGDEPGHRLEVRAVRNGPRRHLQAGEWYISGAIPGAYFAADAPRCRYYPAKLVVVRVRVVEVVTIERTI